MLVFQKGWDLTCLICAPHKASLTRVIFVKGTEEDVLLGKSHTIPKGLYCAVFAGVAQKLISAFLEEKWIVSYSERGY